MNFLITNAYKILIITNILCYNIKGWKKHTKKIELKVIYIKYLVKMRILLIQETVFEAIHLYLANFPFRCVRTDLKTESSGTWTLDRAYSCQREWHQLLVALTVSDTDNMVVCWADTGITAFLTSYHSTIGNPLLYYGIWKISGGW